MKLLTQEIKNRLPKLYATEGVPLAEKEIICKFFTPDANATWYILEGSPINDGSDWEFFCYADLGLGPTCSEFGAVLLSQIQEIRGQLGLPVERDMAYDGWHRKMGEAVEGIC